MHHIMKNRFLFFAFLLLTVAMSSGCKKEDSGSNWITATNSPQTINEQGIASLTFNVVWQWHESGNLPASGLTVNFKATNGSCTSSAVTDAQGNVTCVFTANDPYTFDGATVTASMKHLLNTGGAGTEEMGGVITAEAVVLPLLRPSKNKVKPKITRVGEPPVIEDGKTVFRVRLTEQETGAVKEDPLPGREIRFETDGSKGTCTEKAITDENGEAGCEYKPNDPDHFEGADITAKATVKYSDGNVDVEEKISVAKPDAITYRLTPTESPQKALRLGNDCVFLLEKVTNGNAAPIGGAAVSFTAENGTIAGGYAEGTTTADGLVRTYFTTDDIINFEGGKVLASATVEGEQVQGTLEIDPADVYVKLIWSSSSNSPRYEDGQASFMLNISLILNEKGQEVTLSNGGGGTIKADTDGNGAIISIKDTGQSGGASQSGTGATSLQYDFKLGLLDIGYSIDKQQYANRYPGAFPGDKVKVTVTKLNGFNRFPAEGISAEATVTRFIPELSIDASSPNRIDDNNKCKVKFTYTDRLTGIPMKAKVKFEAEGGKFPSEAESDANGVIEGEFEADQDALILGGKVKGTVVELAVGGGMTDIMPVTHEAAIEPIPLTYKLEPLQEEYGFDPDGKATVTFQLSGTEEATGRTWTELPGKVIRFDTKNGSTDASGDWKTTDEKGQVSVVFTAEDVTKNGTIKARFEYNAESGGIRYAYSPDVPVLPLDYMLVCRNSPQMADESGAASLTFELSAVNGATAELYQNIPGRVVYLTPSNGTCAPSVSTNEVGRMTVAFQLVDLEQQGTVEALYTYKVNGAEKSTLALGIVEPLEEDDIQDEGLKKANKLKDNVYVVNDNEVEVEDLPEGEGMRDYIVYGAKKDNGETKVLFLEFCKEHPVYATVGGGTIHIRPDQLGKEIDMLKEDPNGLCWMNLFSLKDVNQGYNPETNPDTSFSAPSSNNDMAIAKCKFTQNSDGSLTGIAYFKKKDGTEGYFKMKATRKANWSD